MTLTREDVAGLRAGQKVKAAVFETLGAGRFTITDTVLYESVAGDLLCGARYVRHRDGEAGVYLVSIEVEPDPEPVFQRGDLVEAATTDAPDYRRILMSLEGGRFSDGLLYAYTYADLIDPVRMKAVPLDGEDHSEPRDGDVWEARTKSGLRAYLDRKDGEWRWSDGPVFLTAVTPVRYIGRWDS